LTQDQAGRVRRDLRELQAMRAGDDAARDLREALARVGLKFPSLQGGMPVDGRGHVELGGCSADMASRLAAALHAIADTVPARRGPLLRSARDVQPPRRTGETPGDGPGASPDHVARFLGASRSG
jgi:hypothetical protein